MAFKKHCDQCGKEIVGEEPHIFSVVIAKAAEGKRERKIHPAITHLATGTHDKQHVCAPCVIANLEDVIKQLKAPPATAK